LENEGLSPDKTKNEDVGKGFDRKVGPKGS